MWHQGRSGVTLNCIGHGNRASNQGQPSFANFAQLGGALLAIVTAKWLGMNQRASGRLFFRE
jgi:hypothetical protein